jgi:hypothetical protein
MKKILSLLAGLIPFFSFAHEGHGHTDGFTITHYFVEPQHSVTVLIGAVLFYVIYKNVRKEDKA